MNFKQVLQSSYDGRKKFRRKAWPPAERMALLPHCEEEEQSFASIFCYWGERQKLTTKDIFADDWQLVETCPKCGQEC